MGRAPCCDKANVKRGPWSPEEDAVLKAYIETNGTGGNWITLPQRAGLKRCGKSCRLRWLNYLRPEIKHGGFSVEEDAIICALFRALGSRWSVIASRLPGRTDNDVKNYWNTKLKKRYSAQQQKPAAEETPVSVEHAARTTAASTPAATAAVSASSTVPPSLPKLLPNTSGCSYPYLPPVDYSNFGQTAPSNSPLPYRRPPSFMSTSIEESYVVAPRSHDDVSSSAPSGTPSSSLTADYSGASGPLAFGSTTIDNYVLTTPLDLEDASTTSGATATATSSSSLTMDSSGGGGCQPWPVADEYFFAEAEAAFESYYFSSSSSSSSSANLAGLSGAGGAYNWISGAGDSGLLWDVVVDSSYS